MLPRPLSPFVLFLATFPALAQQERPSEPAAFGDDPTVWSIPIHSGTAAHDADYGTWAAGADYKVSFHDGVTFHPCLGSSYETNLPLRWQTVEVGQGPATISVPDTRRRAAHDWHLTFEHPAFEERWDVRPEGLEQSFRFPRPLGTGDLVVRGVVTTPLVGAPCAPRPGELAFRDAQGHAIVLYGRAIAFDATGNVVDVATSFDGETIALTVDGAWLATARWPVTIDPLLTVPFTLGQQTGNLSINHVGSTEIGNDMTGGTHSTLTTYTRIFSASDHDVYALISSAHFGNRVNVLADLSTANSDRNVCVAFVDDPDRWLIAFERTYLLNGQSSQTIRVVAHAMGSTTLNAGTGVSIAQGSPATFANPDLGGAWLSPATYGMLVFQDEGPLVNGEYPYSRVRVARITPNPLAIGAAVEVGTTGSGTRYDRERPAINDRRLGSSGEGWLVVWQELDRSVANDDWEIRGQRFSPTVTAGPTGIVVNGRGSTHAVQPKVSGDGRYLVTCGLSTDLASTAIATLVALPLTWGFGASGPTVGSMRTLATATPILTSITNQSLAADSFLGAFHTATWTTARFVALSVRTSATIARLSYRGVPVETATLFSDPTFSATSPSVGYAYPEEHFVTVYGTNENTGSRSNLLYGNVFDYHPDAGEIRYGIGCGAAHIDGNRPYAGNVNYRVGFSSGPPNAPFVLFVGIAPANLPLDTLGMTGCVALIDLTQYVFTANGTVDAAGLASVPFPLPDDPALTGDLWFQFAYVAPGANPANLLTTRGLESRIR